jgi:hypothetical protein
VNIIIGRRRITQAISALIGVAVAGQDRPVRANQTQEMAEELSQIPIIQIGQDFGYNEHFQAFTFQQGEDTCYITAAKGGGSHIFCLK